MLRGGPRSRLTDDAAKDDGAALTSPCSRPSPTSAAPSPTARAPRQRRRACRLHGSGLDRRTHTSSTGPRSRRGRDTTARGASASTTTQAASSPCEREETGVDPFVKRHPGGLDEVSRAYTSTRRYREWHLEQDREVRARDRRPRACSRCARPRAAGRGRNPDRRASSRRSGHRRRRVRRKAKRRPRCAHA